MGTVKQLYKKKDKMRIWMTRGGIQESKRKKLNKVYTMWKIDERHQIYKGSI